MVKDDECMAIIMQSDNNYAKIMATAMTSIMLSNMGGSLKFYIVNDNISKDNILFIENLVKIKHCNASICWIDFNEIVAKYDLDILLKVDSNWPPATYGYLFAIEYVNEDKAIFVDDDVICVGSLKELWKINLGKNEILAGVLDTCEQELNTNYVNAGVNVFDIQKWKDGLYTKEIIEYIKGKEGIIHFADQEVLNNVFLNKIKIISPRYNAITPIFMISHKKIMKYWRMKHYYDENEIDEARRNPVCIHFTSFISVRPWQSGCRHPMKKEFEKMWYEMSGTTIQYDKFVFGLYKRFIYGMLYYFPWWVFSLYRYFVIKTFRIRKILRWILWRRYEDE